MMLHLEYSVQCWAQYKWGTGKLEWVQRRPLPWLGVETGQERLRETGFVSLWEEWTEGVWIAALYSLRQGWKEDRARLFFGGAQQGEWEAMAASCGKVNSSWTWGENSSWRGWLSTGAGCPGGWWNLLLWGDSELRWKKPWATWSNFEDTCPEYIGENIQRSLSS